MESDRLSNRYNVIFHSLIAPDSSSTPLTLVSIMSLIVLNHFSSHLQSVPKVHLFESRICASYYSAYPPNAYGSSLPIDESMCKIPEIQKELSTVLGFLTFFNAVPRRSILRKLEAPG